MWFLIILGSMRDCAYIVKAAASHVEPDCQFCSACTFKNNDDGRIGDSKIYFPGDGDGKVHLVNLEEPVDVIAVQEYLRDASNNGYWLYTRENPSIAQMLVLDDIDSIKESNFDAKKETVFLAHGWNGNGNNEMNRMLTEAFLQALDVNVIVLDWSGLANRNYVTVTCGVPGVGRGLGQFVIWLTTLGVSYDQVHLVGYSLGGHLVGNAGRETNGRVKRITALDPAGLLWKKNNERIIKSDGQYVEVIHTSIPIAGYAYPCGDVDHYPNAGYGMPGCWTCSCSHSRSYKYFASTILHKHIFGNQCKNLVEVITNYCTGELFPMGNADINKTGFGIYRANTKADYPF